MDDRSRSELLKDWALEEGFDRVGVADLEPMEHGETFERWLERGDQAGMQYLERRREVRSNPRRILEGARSVVCVAYQYHPLSGEEPPLGDLWPHVARYARGRDYHTIMGGALERLAARVRAGFPGSATRAYVDTGPVLERELAARAGLGAVGKNTNLLTARGGSWFLLGELFSTLELSADIPASDLCGTCTECLEACPTGALPAPYRLDSRKCISYWTIEHREGIPVDMRAQIGSWVFGCDVCQEVCPVNTAADAADHPELQLTAERRHLDLAGLLRLSRTDYTEIFRDSPMKRAKLEGLQRNAAVAMGNSGSQRHVEALVEGLSAASAVVRGHVAWALGQIGGPKAKAALRLALRSEADSGVRTELEEALEALG